MKLCVVGKDSLDELEAYVTEIFQPIPYKPELKYPVSYFDADPVKPFTSEQLKKCVKFVPVKDMTTISLLWPMVRFVG